MENIKPINTVIYLRMIFIPFFVMFLLMDNVYARLIALLIFVTECGIDIYENHISVTSYNANTGGILSVLIDKLMISLAFICFAGMKTLSIPVWMVIPIVLNEYVTSGLKNIAASRKDNISIRTNPKSRFVPKGGIIIILTLLAVISIIENAPALSITDANKFLFEAVPYWVTLVIAGFSAASGVNCVIRNIKVLKEEKNG